MKVMSEVQTVGAPFIVPAPMSDADLRKRERIRRKRLRSNIESLAAPALALALLLAWQIAVPLFNVERAVLPTPFDILKRTVTDYALVRPTAGSPLPKWCRISLRCHRRHMTALAVFYSTHRASAPSIRCWWPCRPFPKWRFGAASHSLPGS